MINTIQIFPNKTVIDGSLIEEEIMFVSHFGFVLEKNKVYSIKSALIELQAYYKNDKVDAIIKSICIENKLHYPVLP